MWLALSTEARQVNISFTADSDSTLSFYMLGCGVVHHKHLDWARDNKPVLLENMYQFSPEANFYSTEGTVEQDDIPEAGQTADIYLKSCNRCARFLPINIYNQRKHLSFSNHCVAEKRRPCQHAGFGKLKNIDTGDVMNLEYGYQLECRFCKKYEVNAAHNPQRTPSQMKEDGARRRAIELLLADMYKVSRQLQYRHDNQGKELAEIIWNKFNRQCFNCGTSLATSKEMHLDHTRPLALLWPLDETATCLCGSCNSQKRDRPPVEFYTADQLVSLSRVTGVPLSGLQNPTPNMDAVNHLLSRLDWFFDEFLKRPELAKERDGKVSAELLVKALQKTLNKCGGGAPADLNKMYEKRLGTN